MKNKMSIMLKLEELDHSSVDEVQSGNRSGKEPPFKELELVAWTEEISWRQKSKCVWIKDGDKNTKFFHKMANAHKRYNNVDKFEVDGKSIEDAKLIRNIYWASMKNDFTEDEEWGPKWKGYKLVVLTEGERNWMQTPS